MSGLTPYNVSNKGVQTELIYYPSGHWERENRDSASLTAWIADINAPRDSGIGSSSQEQYADVPTQNKSNDVNIVGWDGADDPVKSHSTSLIPLPR